MIAISIATGYAVKREALLARNALLLSWRTARGTLQPSMALGVYLQEDLPTWPELPMTEARVMVDRCLLPVAREA
jgi:hypothetical protein